MKIGAIIEWKELMGGRREFLVISHDEETVCYWDERSRNAHFISMDGLRAMDATVDGEVIK